MGVHHNLVLFLRMVLFMKRFWQKIPFGQRVQFGPAHVFGGHHYELVGIQVWTLFDGDIVCNDWGGSLQSLRWPRWAREDPRNLGVIDQRGRARRPGDPRHNRGSIVATGSPGAAQEKGGRWEGGVGRIEFHNMCEEHLPHDMLSSASVSLPLEKSFAACIEYWLWRVLDTYQPPNHLKI